VRSSQSHFSRLQRKEDQTVKPFFIGAFVCAILTSLLAAQTRPPATPDFPEQAGAQRGGSTKTMFPEVRALHEMVGGGNNFVVEAGMRMLREGGNAVDAGVAAVLAAAVTEEDHFSMGGEMPALINMNGQPVQVISGIGTAPAKATIDFFKNRPLEPWETADRKAPIPAQGILATTTPGMFDGVMLALEKFGTMTFAKVAEPAIELADGFPTTEVFSDTLKRDDSMLERWPTSVNVFYPGGKLPGPGEIFHQPDLPRTGPASSSRFVRLKNV
jgi:gamma-glutamyltranspeptidase / glutathione hydrolase